MDEIRKRKKETKKKREKKIKKRRDIFFLQKIKSILKMVKNVVSTLRRNYIDVKQARLLG